MVVVVILPTYFNYKTHFNGIKPGPISDPGCGCDIDQ